MTDTSSASMEDIPDPRGVARAGVPERVNLVTMVGLLGLDEDATAAATATTVITINDIVAVLLPERYTVSLWETHGPCALSVSTG